MKSEFLLFHVKLCKFISINWILLLFRNVKHSGALVNYVNLRIGLLLDRIPVSGVGLPRATALTPNEVIEERRTPD